MGINYINMAEDKIFADGFLFKKRESAPEWVVGSISVKVDEAIGFLTSNAKNGWVNLNVNQSRGGKYYIELDTFVPKKQEPSSTKEKEVDLPF
tara:strand:- start:998 stop:1276 length:279 start_codon:yes stop_codon:yes gene_type:complete